MPEQVTTYKGFVVGSDDISNRIVWKVRVKDPTSRYNRQKFVVISVRNNATLASGVDVEFQLASIGKPGKDILGAVDVQPVIAQPQQAKRSNTHGKTERNKK